MATKDKEVALYEKKVNPLVQRAQSFEIKNPDDMKVATEMLSQMNRIGDAIEAEKQKVLKPLNQALKAERARWKPIETMWESGISAIRKAMSVWQTEQTRIARQEEDRIAARVGEGRGKLKAETAMQQIAEIDRPESAIVADDGLVKFRTVKKLVIDDAGKIPRTYLVPDEAMIKNALIGGTDVPGAHIEEEQVPVNFR